MIFFYVIMILCQRFRHVLVSQCFMMPPTHSVLDIKDLQLEININTMFSFDPVKSITCIDGGAIVIKGIAEQKRLHVDYRDDPTSAQMYTNSRAWT